jgi:hypothetical protein
MSRKIVTVPASHTAPSQNKKNSYWPRNMITMPVIARKTITPSDYGLTGEWRTVMNRVTLMEPKNKGSV